MPPSKPTGRPPGRPRIHDEPQRHTSLRLPESLWRELQARAEREGRSMTLVAVEALRRGLR